VGVVLGSNPGVNYFFFFHFNYKLLRKEYIKGHFISN